MTASRSGDAQLASYSLNSVKLPRSSQKSTTFRGRLFRLSSTIDCCRRWMGLEFFAQQCQAQAAESDALVSSPILLIVTLSHTFDLRRSGVSSESEPNFVHSWKWAQNWLLDVTGEHVVGSVLIH